MIKTIVNHSDNFTAITTNIFTYKHTVMNGISEIMPSVTLIWINLDNQSNINQLDALCSTTEMFH